MPVLLIALLLLVSPLAAMPADSTASLADSLTAATTAVAMPSLGTMVFNTIAGLLVVIALIWVMVWLLKKLNTLGQGKGAANGKLITSIPLGPKQAVQIVLLYNQVYILGSGPQGISLLDKITDPEKVESILKAGQNNGPAGFKNILGKFIGKDQPVNLPKNN